MSEQAVEERRGWASDIVWVDTGRVYQPAGRLRGLIGSHALRQHPASVEQTPVVGEVDRMAQMPRVELDHRMPEMLAHRVLTDLERIRDRPRPTADGIHAQDLALAISQSAGWQRCVEPFFGRQFHRGAFPQSERRRDGREGDHRCGQEGPVRGGGGTAVMSPACMSSEHFGQSAWQFKRMSGSSGLKVQAAIAC